MSGWLRGLAFRVRALWRSEAIHGEIDEELRFHLDMSTAENVRRGMSPEEARREAERRFGGLARMKERGYDVRGGRWLECAAQDLRYGLRGLVRNRGFAVVAVLTLGLGIGANTAVFSVINAVFLRPLPYADPDRLVTVWELEAQADNRINNLPPGNYADLRANNTVFEDMAALHPAEFTLTGDGEPERVPAFAISANLLSVVGVRPELGRGFLPEEDAPGGPDAALISHALWQRRYGGAPDVLGREIVLDGTRCAIVGVMPPGFQLMEFPADAWVPVALDARALADRRSHYIKVYARLRPGVTAEQAEAEMQAMMERIIREYPNQPAEIHARVIPVREYLTGDARKPLLVLLVAVALVLLIACINVGNLMLSRAAARGREIAVRAALGASPARMVRQLLVENVPLVVLGTAVGLLFASWALDFLRQLVPAGIAQSAELGLDPRVLAFTFLIALGATVVFGLVPAFQAMKVDLNDVLRRSGARAGFSAGGRLQSALVVGEVCLAITLLVGASLFIQTFFELQGQYSSLEGSSALTMRTVLSRAAYDTHPKIEAFTSAVLERVRALPGVTAAGFTNALPLDYKGDSTTFTPEGIPQEPGRPNLANIRLVTPDFLRAFGVTLRAGRAFSESDGPQSQPVVIVNETMARKYWPGQDVVGRRLKVGDPEDDLPMATIVGVVADVRQDGVDMPPSPEMTFPLRQCDYMSWVVPRTLVIRTSGDQGAVAAAARRVIAEVDPNQPVSDVRTMSDVLGKETSGRRLGTLLLGAFAAVALLLASIGIYGLLSQRVQQMTPEIGVRLALGARPRDMVALVVARGMKLVLIGSAAGVALSLALTRLAESLLFGVSAGDPLTLAGVPALLAAVALVACYVPARRAAGVDPNVALRYE